MRIRRRRDELERRLDSERPQPPDEFISRLDRAHHTGADPASQRLEHRTRRKLHDAADRGARADGRNRLRSGRCQERNDGRYVPRLELGRPREVERELRHVERELRQVRQVGPRAPASRTRAPASRTRAPASPGTRTSRQRLTTRATTLPRDRAHREITSRPCAMSRPGTPTTPTRSSWTTSAVPTHLDHGDTLGPCPEEPGPPDDQYEEKVLICHIPPGNPENAHTISVSVNAVPAHLAHGDYGRAVPRRRQRGLAV